MTDLQRAVHERKLAEAQVEVALGQLLVAERLQKSPADRNTAVRVLVSTLILSAEATRRLATALAIDADIYEEGADVDQIMPPVIDHVD